MRPCQYCRAPVSNDVVLCENCQGKGITERPLPSASELPSDADSVKEHTKPHWTIQLLGAVMEIVGVAGQGLVAFVVLGALGLLFYIFQGAIGGFLLYGMSAVLVLVVIILIVGSLS